SKGDGCGATEVGDPQRVRRDTVARKGERGGFGATDDREPADVRELLGRRRRVFVECGEERRFRPRGERLPGRPEPALHRGMARRGGRGSAAWRRLPGGSKGGGAKGRGGGEWATEWSASRRPSGGFGEKGHAQLVVREVALLRQASEGPDGLAVAKIRAERHE